jgi:hypothetical protein
MVQGMAQWQPRIWAEGLDVVRTAVVAGGAVNMSR